MGRSYWGPWKQGKARKYMLDISERDESAGETALRFGCKYHLSGLLRSQACTDITGEIATLRLKKNKKHDKISLK